MTAFSSPYVLALDQGTSSSRAVVFDAAGAQVASHCELLDVKCPEPGWAEMDAMELLDSVYICVEAAVAAAGRKGVSASEIRAVGITNQRETTIVWNRLTGKPLCPAIVWLDARTQKTVNELTARAGGDKFVLADKCGLPLSTYFSAVKLHWLLAHDERVRSSVAEGVCMFGTVDTWLIWNLSGRKAHVTDVTNASRTMLMDLSSCVWDPKLCEFFGIPVDILPEIRSSAEVYASVAHGPVAGTPISACLGDQQAAVVGQLCFRAGQVKSTYGTGAFMLFNTGEAQVRSTHGLLTTVCYKLGAAEPTVYALEGSIAVAGVAVKWLRDNMGMCASAPECDDLAASVPDCGGLFFVPAFGGLLAPHWRPDARGLAIGFTQYTTKAHFARAVLEAACFQTLDVLEAMVKDAGVALETLLVDGGMANSKIMLQILADVLAVPVVRPPNLETTAYGAALAAGIGAGLWTRESAVACSLQLTETAEFKPSIAAEERSARIAQWRRALERTLGWATGN